MGSDLPPVCPHPRSGARRSGGRGSSTPPPRGTGPWLALLALLAGCGDGATAEFPDLAVKLSEVIPTVATVHWAASTEGSTEAHVEVLGGDGGTWQVRAERSGSQSFEATILGMRPNREYGLVAVVVDDQGARTSDEITVRTGGLPQGLTHLTLDDERWDPDRADRGFLFTSLMPGPALILDGEGEVVWWHEPDVDHGHIISRLLPSRDGRSLLYLVWTTRQNGGMESETRFLARVSLDGVEVETVPLPMAHHDFCELPDGTVAVVMYDPLEIDGQQVAGDRLVEVAADGSERTVWSVWDDVLWDPELSFEGGEVWGHCNALRYDEGDDAYTLSCRNFSTLYRIDRGTGELLWRIGRTDGDFALVGDEDATWFQNQHQFRLEDDRLLVFDNGAQGGTGTRAAELALDPEAMEAEIVWTFQPDPSLGVYAYGDVQRLPSGNTLVDWGSAGRLDEVTPEGDIVRRIDVELGAGLGYMTRAADLQGGP